MKKYLFLFSCLTILFLLLNCSQQDTIIKKYYTNNIPDDATVIKVFPEISEPMSSLEFKSMNYAPKMKSLITTQNDPEVDFANGILYYENSYQYFIDNSLNPDRTLDLSNIIGAKANIVYLMVRYVNGCEDEVAGIYFKPYGYNVEYSEMSVIGPNDVNGICSTITDSQGQLSWYHDYSWHFNHSGVYKAKKIEIYAIFYSNGIIVNN
jgi:hypothetical protein